MSGCSGRIVLASPVKVIRGQNSYEACHLEAICGISEDQPAMLIVYQESTLTERVIIRKIPFTCVKNVGQVEDRHRMINVINFQEDDDEFLFYGESATSTEKWFGCCWLLLSLPSHFIPIVPEENLVPQNLIDEYSNNHILDAVCVWVVYILKEGIVMDYPTLAGLRVISIRSSDCTFNIHDYHSGDLLMSWDRAAIRRSGCMKSLVFLEASKHCKRGPGLLWMHHPLPHTKELRQCLHDFLDHGPQSFSKERSATQISCDGLKFKSYQSYEDEPSVQPSDGSQQQSDDVLCSTTSLLKQNPALQALNDYNGLSQGSTASSGYCSDSGINNFSIHNTWSSSESSLNCHDEQSSISG